MPTLPAELLPLIVEFAPLFSKPVWERAKSSPVGAILAVGKRTVTALALARRSGPFQHLHLAPPANLNKQQNRKDHNLIVISSLGLFLLEENWIYSSGLLRSENPRW